MRAWLTVPAGPVWLFLSPQLEALMTGILDVREATENDVEFLASVLLLTYEKLGAELPDWNAVRFLKQVTEAAEEEVAGLKENSITYVVESDGAPIGRLRLVRPGDTVYVAGIQLLPTHQRKGIGSTLLHSVVKEADEDELTVTLHVGKENPDALRLYRRLGFEVIENRGDRELMELRTSEKIDD